MQVWPVQHAKARFSELLDACQREGPQVVSRRGIETEQGQRHRSLARSVKREKYHLAQIGFDLGKNSSWPRHSSGSMELGPAAGKRGCYCNHLDL